jgi:hypothetical protein
MTNQSFSACHLVPNRLFLQPQRRASGAAGSGSEAQADAISRRLHALVRLF